ncbi:MAG: hypothetical protein C0494_10560 [Sphingobium sp.]|nr:hypothetical protein [Sphingobium sp.]
MDALETPTLSSTDQQISLTDPDARSMFSSGQLGIRRAAMARIKMNRQGIKPYRTIASIT